MMSKTSDMKNRILPTSRQLEYQNWEFGMFLHFGIRTFYDYTNDFGNAKMDPARFNPSELDCENWVKTAKDAGMKYLVLVAKHHDGFALWPSAYTAFCVKSSPWKQGKGDVVREFTDACRKHGMAIGLYYSPFDADSTAYADPKGYDDYFINQISELLLNYGKIDMLWFDGCGSEGHTYDWKRIIGRIRDMQKELLIFGSADPNYRWVGNEAGFAPSPCFNVVNEVPVSILTDEKDRISGTESRWLPAECDCRMRYSNWFFNQHDADTVKSLDELMGIYYYSVGRGCNLLLNIGPDRRGLLPQRDAENLLAMGMEIKRRFSSPVLQLKDFGRNGNVWSFKPKEKILIDHLIVSEDIRFGESVTRFRIQVKPGTDAVTVYEGTSIGHKAICQFPPICATTILFEVLDSTGDISIDTLNVYNTHKEVN